MPEEKSLAARFDAARPQLRSVAYRMLGSLSEADDAVQEAWLRVSGADTAQVDNLGGWLTTVVARLCLDLLRARKARRDGARPGDDIEAVLTAQPNAEDDRVLADSAGIALLVVLETLAPAERLAFVLHDAFDLPFDEIANVVGCTPTAARQLASRARRRVRGAPPELEAEADLEQQRAVVQAFLGASRSGDLTGLMAILDPNVVLRADAKAVARAAASQAPGTPQLEAELHGAGSVANSFSGRAQAAQPALINGAVGAVWAPLGKVQVAFDFSIEQGKVVRIDVIADQARLARFDLRILDGA